MEKIPISVIIPIFNTENYLKRCLDSVLSQTFKDFECILINDGSSDNCPEICDSYSKIDNRIKIIHNPNNYGLPQSRKIGLSFSQGEYIQFIDSDDWIESDMLERMYKTAISGNYDMVYCNFYMYDKYKKPSLLKVAFYKEPYQNIRKIILGYNKNRGTELPIKLIKKSVYDSIIFPFENFLEDKYIMTQIFYYTKNLGHINSAFYHYEYNPNSIVNDSQTQVKRYSDQKSIFDQIINFLKIKYNVLNIFEPELSIRLMKIENTNPKKFQNIVKRILKFLIPFKPIRNVLKYTYNYLISTFSSNKPTLQ